MPAVHSTDATPRAPDLLVCSLLCAATVTYLAVLPRDLGRADEAFFLVEAKRVLHGDLMYRDLFWFAGPIGQWWMAGVFAIFGVTITAARLAMAALQAALVALLYLSSRRCGVRPILALGPPLLYLGFCFGIWPYASPHWISTLMMAAILYTLLAPGRAARPVNAVLPGLCIGTLALSHQHQGAAFALAAVAVFAAEGAIARRSGHPPPPRTWWYTSLWCALGTAAVALPAIVILLATTGAGPLVELLVVHPLTGYRRYNRTVWGTVTLASFAPYTWPALLRYSPLALLPALLRLARGWRQRRPLAELGPLATLVIIGGAAIISVSYMPDVVHVGFIAPLLFVAGAEALEALLRWMESRHVAARRVAVLVGVALLVIATVRLVRTYQLRWRDHPLHVQTAFGGVDFATAQEGRLIELINTVMADQPRRLLFAYPSWSSIYLTADTENPTAHPLFMPGYLPPEEIERTIAALASQRPPYILAIGLGDAPNDRIMPWVLEHYDLYRTDADPKLPYRLYRRRDAAP